MIWSTSNAEGCISYVVIRDMRFWKKYANSDSVCHTQAQVMFQLILRKFKENKLMVEKVFEYTGLNEEDCRIFSVFLAI